MSERFPTGITLHQKSRVMELAFSDGHNTGIYSWDYEALVTRS